jgi:hypothetical protein
MMSSEVNDNCSRAPSQEAISFKGNKRNVSKAEEKDDVILRALDNIAKAFNRATDVLERAFGSKISGQDTYAALEEMDLESSFLMEAYICLMLNPQNQETFFGCPITKRKEILLKLMSRSYN